MMHKKVIIIGAGIGGLSTAIRLAANNYQVEVYESAPIYGGKTKRIEKDGFTWGYGASLFTMPHQLDELFILCKKNPRDFYTYHALDPICKYFFADGTILNARADKELLVEEISQKLHEDKVSLQKHLRSISIIFKHTEHIFLQSSLHKFKTYFQFKTLKSMLNLWNIGLTRTMNDKNQSLFKQKNTIQLFNRYATYNGSSPYKTPATMNVIAAPEYTQGAYIMDKGMPQVAEVLYQLALEQGVHFHFNTKVDEILIENNNVKGVQIKDQQYLADIVVSNVDIDYTYKNLIPNATKPLPILNQERSTSAIIYYLGISKSFDMLETHNIFFSDIYENEFDSIQKGEVYKDATAYLFISSKKIKSHAPANMENWFLLINAPHNQGQDWEKIAQQCKKQMLAKVSTYVGEDVSNYIISEQLNTPITIEKDTHSVAGSLYGASSNNKMSAFLRHPNFSKEITNLYFTGGSVHPGGGVPLCLLSGKIVADLITS